MLPGEKKAGLLFALLEKERLFCTKTEEEWCQTDILQ
jgi:hypothetical protein